MKAYVCSVGERTTKICCEQLARYGFEVVLLDKKEPWLDKYKSFIFNTDEDCLRIDADTIVNKNILKIHFDLGFYPREHNLMIQYHGYDFYKNDIGIVSPIFYRKEALKIIREHWEELGDKTRPEASAWRLEALKKFTYTSDLIVGAHGIGATMDMLERARNNKISRKQLHEYDFYLAEKIINLYEKN